MIKRKGYIRYSTSDEPVQKKSAWHHFFMIVLIVMFAFTALSMQGCAESVNPCKDWQVKHYEMTIATYEECKALLNCELDRTDVYYYMEAQRDLEECKVAVPEVIIK